ncbi:MAG: T9SS type A sorting domain-containing protein [Bacteroidota bacterium]
MNKSLPLITGMMLMAAGGLSAQTTFGGGPAPIVDSLTFTGAMQVYTVPCGVTSLLIEAYGAQGGNGATGGNSSTGGAGAAGGYSSGALTVVPGQTLFIYVGGSGATPTGGFNGGASGGSQNAGGGGGATDVRVNSSNVADRVLVAGGGGGGGRGGCEQAIVNGGNGGNGGGGNGANGADAPTPGGVAGGGFGAVGANAGAAGIGCGGFLGQPGLTATNESGANGGNGQTCCCFGAPSIPGGGGGGGGFIGGGGGGGGSAGTTGCSGNDKGGGGGGAGGSSYNGGMTTAGALIAGIRTGNGVVRITYADPTPSLLSFTTTTTAVCPGNQINVSVNADPNSTSYNWVAAGGLVINSGNGTATVNVTATGAGSLTVNGVNACTTGPASTFQLGVLPAPTVTASTAQTICETNFATISATGGDTYLWSTGDTTSTIIVAPVTTTTYTVIGYNNSLCSDTDFVTVTVNPLPVITASSSPQTICAGSTAQISATGGDIYSWSTGDTTATVAVTPTVTTSYTVTGTNTFTACNNIDTVTVIVNPLPTVTLALGSTQVCLADGAGTLSGGSPAGGSYSGPGVSGGNFTPATAGLGTHTITYTFTDVNGCTNIATQNIVVDACVGITEASAIGMTLMPNPATTQINLIWTVELTSIEIMDAQGRLVITKAVNNTNSLIVDLTELPAGVYSVRYNNNNTVAAQQTFVKQ